MAAPTGFMTGTRVASNLGWTNVETLALGDKVLTFDNGMQVVTDIQRDVLWDVPDRVARALWPMHVPRGALGNRVDMQLMPDQGVMIESDAVVDVLGDPFAIVPARALNGYHGIAPMVPSDPCEIIVLSFDTDEVIYAEGGLLAYCPRPRCIVRDDFQALDMFYTVLDMPAATMLIEDMTAQGTPQLT
ncbi:Hint domain-containing protein [Thalassococcus sp. S3]|uniref:Hint domain-containing protein n=1 Tax=Thalassococcus sp. S3 TaxID=2017482 RepID=UPI0013EE9926|nr:Hint domain-containing protein [Thalassococcus sp. S3]